MPVTSEADATHDFEQLQVLLSEGLTAGNLKAEAVTESKLAKEAVSEAKLAAAVQHKLLGTTAPEATVERKSGEALEPSATKACFVQLTLVVAANKNVLLELLSAGTVTGKLGTFGGTPPAFENYLSTMLYVPAGKKWEAKLAVGEAAAFKLFSSYTFAS